MQEINNNIDFGRILKQVKNVQVNENSLDLKFPKRTIVDISTDNFIKVMFQDDKNYYLFLNYVNALYFYLNYLGNIDLLHRNLKPIHENEIIEVFFKGGNVLNYHFSTMVKDQRIKELFAAFFKKSDFDFSVNIHTKSDNRFDQLKRSFYPFIIRYLKQTTRLFNEYLADVLSNNVNITSPNTNFLRNFKNDNDTMIYLETLDTIKDIIAQPKFLSTKEIIDNYFKMFSVTYIPAIEQITNVGKYVRVLFSNGDFVQFISKTHLSMAQDKQSLNKINDIINQYNEHIINNLSLTYNRLYKTSKYYSCLLYPYYKYLLMSIGNHELEYQNLLDHVIRYNFNIIKQANFYTVEKLVTMINGISEAMNELNDTYYDTNSENPPDEQEYNNPAAFNNYTINKNNINPNNIIIEPANDFIMYNDFEKPDGRVVTGIDNVTRTRRGVTTNIQNIHYVSSNLTIKNISGNRQVLDFDLFRIKFNIVARNIVEKNGVLQESFNIPSEFIDVSVTTIESTNYNEDHGMFIMPINLSDVLLPNIPVKSHSYTYFINDLIRILFVDVNFFPWTKGKYEKRLKRLLLLLYLYDGRHNTKYLETLRDLAEKVRYNVTYLDKEQIDLSEYSRSPVYLESYDEYINIYDLVYVDEKYNIIRYPIKLLLIMSEILKTDNALDIINHFRKYLKINPLTSLGNLREEFIQFLDEIINTYNDMSPGVNPYNVDNSYATIRKTNYSKLKKE
uniref:Uncharacterized protein n=1 Tax=Moumouvirus sp. 'Monve' TaxID=1128131 RepID=H2EDY9_9VIRU|nr:hypothetical protein mv_R407 [Moumouvirus Monve]